MSTDTVNPAHDTARGPISETAKISTDDTHTFFFDHPLDHIPGMLLVDTALHRAEQAAGRHAAGPLRVQDLDLTFNGLCEHGSEALVHLRENQPGSRTFNLDVRQDGTSVCTGSLRLEPAPRRELFVEPPGQASGHDRPRRASAELVHKRSLDNILIGPLRQTGEHSYTTVMIAPPAERWPDVHPTTVLVEAIRQTATLTSHTAWDIPTDWQYILMSIHLTLTGTATWPAAPELICHVSPLKGRARGGIDIAVQVDGAQVGHMHLKARAVPPAAYQRMREASAKTAEATA
ncbi:hypothetical protein LVX13_27095 [Streptomyces albulus]|uniref:AfsA-related hotdog domain-containing protein n=1 Tax=Streptomyces TaxID=1883 RepID=UPI001F43C164|nr:AfsA-related hotdog domain-containing protein [Streptomyces noursei]MCE4946758.1 hypothetical protein [Streptomyces noursei]